MESLDPHIFSMFTYLDVMPGQADTLQGLLAWCPHVPRVTHDGICLLFLSLYLSLSLFLSQVHTTSHLSEIIIKH